jgi:hypothetical protein
MLPLPLQRVWKTMCGSFLGGLKRVHVLAAHPVASCSTPVGDQAVWQV